MKKSSNAGTWFGILLLFLDSPSSMYESERLVTIAQ
jgi:hypothetical protein